MSTSLFAELDPPYATIVADPPWQYDEGWPKSNGQGQRGNTELGPGGAYASTTEFVLFCRRGHLPPLRRCDSTWWQWSRDGHSRKPSGFLDVVEAVSPGPYVELFARAPRLGWDSWGKGYEIDGVTQP